MKPAHGLGAGTTLVILELIASAAGEGSQAPEAHCTLASILMKTMRITSAISACPTSHTRCVLVTVLVVLAAQ